LDFELTVDQLAVQARARAAAVEVLAPQARRADEERRFDRKIMAELGRRGLLDPSPGAVAMSLVYEELGRVDSSVRGCVTVQVGLVCRCLTDWASAAQREEWLPRLGSGLALGCYALTEPEAGSDARAIATRALEEGDGWVLDGVKHWITNGGVAELAIVFAQTDEGLTAFLVPTDLPGFEREPMPGQELGHRGSDHALIRLNAVRVPAESVLGEPGQGFAVAMGALRHGRLGVASGAVGILQACLDASVDFARSRRQFGRRIGDFEMIQASLADMAADLAAARLLVREAAWLADIGQDNSSAVAVAKLFACEAALRGADQAILIHGARGYSSEYPVERYWRDAKGMQIYEGTAHIQRVIIARGLLGKDTATHQEA
jgi:alkylation response protein AidB-like acyl-CoA dehydrogenase